MWPTKCFSSMAKHAQELCADVVLARTPRPCLRPALVQDAHRVGRGRGCHEVTSHRVLLLLWLGNSSRAFWQLAVERIFNRPL